MIMRYVQIRRGHQEGNDQLYLGSQDVFLEKDAWVEFLSMSRSLTDKFMWEWHSKKEENIQRGRIQNHMRSLETCE